MKKLIYIISDIEKALAFEWISCALKSKIHLVFIIIGSKDSPLMEFLGNNRIRTYHISNKLNLIRQWFAVLRILWIEKADIVHTHMWKANLLGLTTAWALNVKQRIFTRHHAMIHYREYPSGLKWDKLCNWLATDIVAVSENTEHILTKYDAVGAKKITTVHHGFDLNYFLSTEHDRVNELRVKYGINTLMTPVIGVIARYIRWKGIQFTIEAFKEVKMRYPHAHLVLANANGDHRKEIQSRLSALPQGSHTEIVFEEDLSALYKLFDVYVHVPTDSLSEAFGQTYIEALAAGIPSVFTLSGVAKEFIINEENALVVNYENSQEIAAAICRILQEKDLRLKLISNGLKSINKFSLNNMLNRLMMLYE